MRYSKLSALVVAAALTGAPMINALADTAPVTERAAAPVRAEEPGVSADAARYAEREAASTSVSNFSGGRGEVVIVGTSTLAVVLIVLLVVIML